MAKITKQIDLNLSQVPRSMRSRVKSEVGEFILNEIKLSLRNGESPVEGESFAPLSAKYADEFKGGDRTPDLELTGDMVDALQAKETSSGVEIGIFAGPEVDKADGHNDFSGDSKLPRRRFIPDQDQSFDAFIQSGIDRIIRRNTIPDDRDDSRGGRRVLGVDVNDTQSQEISLDDIFGDSDILGDLF
jgi:hypothetical protein